MQCHPQPELSKHPREDGWAIPRRQQTDLDSKAVLDSPTDNFMETWKSSSSEQSKNVSIKHKQPWFCHYVVATIIYWRDKSTSIFHSSCTWQWIRSKRDRCHMAELNVIYCPLYTVWVCEKDFMRTSYFILRSTKQGLLGLQNLAVRWKWKLSL